MEYTLKERVVHIADFHGLQNYRFVNNERMNVCADRKKTKKSVFRGFFLELSDQYRERKWSNNALFRFMYGVINA